MAAVRQVRNQTKVGDPIPPSSTLGIINALTDPRVQFLDGPVTHPIPCMYVKVGIALSVVQEANMMDLLHRMGAVSDRGEHCQWIDASVALAAISLAGEKAGGRFFQDKVREQDVEKYTFISCLA